MREVARISRIIMLFAQIWSCNPDLRFCQLYTIIFGEGDNFYLEDDKAEKMLKEFYEKRRSI